MKKLPVALILIICSITVAAWYIYDTAKTELEQNLDDAFIYSLYNTSNFILSRIQIKDNNIDTNSFKKDINLFLEEDIDDRRSNDKTPPIDIFLEDESGKCLYDTINDKRCSRERGEVYYYIDSPIFRDGTEFGKLTVATNVKLSQEFLLKELKIYISSSLALLLLSIIATLAFLKLRAKHQIKQQQQIRFNNNFTNELVHQLVKRIGPARSAIEKLLFSSDLNTKEGGKLNIINECISENGEIDVVSNRFAHLANLQTKIIGKKNKSDVRDFIKTVIDRRYLKEKIKTKKIKIKYDIKKSFNVDLVLDSTIVDKKSYFAEEALECILDNALDFTPISSTIEIQVKKLGDYLTISVFDQGKGLESWIEDKILKDVGFSYRPSAKKSTGLGLWIVKFIMEDLHNGHINIKNRPADSGKGAVATLSFPIK